MAIRENGKKTSRKGARKSARRTPARASRKVARQARSKTKVVRKRVGEAVKRVARTVRAKAKAVRKAARFRAVKVTPTSVSVTVPALRGLMERLLQSTGMNANHAKTVAHIFVEANLRGIPVQGLNHLHTMMGKLRSGAVKPNALPMHTKETPGTATVDGNKGPGQLAGIYAADLAVAKAKKSGFCTVGIINSADLYMLAYYAERMARKGMVGLVFSNATPAVHPTGGVEKLLGTNPLAMAVPTAGEDPIVLDMATSATLMTHVRYAAARGEKIPEGVAIGPDGRPTTDAKRAVQGALSPLGGHKGYGLSLAVTLLSGALVGGAMGRGLMDAPGPAGPKGHLFMAIDPAAFGSPIAFRKRVSAYAREVKESRKAPGVKAIRMPGERSFADRRSSLKAGRISIDPMLWQNTAKLAGEMGVTMPS
jgi:L-2-hydroxycarboxylate dehydrogenase (NAD+)